MSQPPRVVNLPPPPPATTLARDAFGRELRPAAAPQSPSGVAGNDPLLPQAAGSKKESATDAIGRRAGALSDELDFPAFVSSLVHGTFNAMVDSSIRQMQSFADLVAAAAKPVEQFTQENVSLNQARDYLVEQYPRDVMLVQQDGQFTLAPASSDEDADAPQWLEEYGMQGQSLTAEMLEQQLLPLAREQVARARLQTLSTMVLMGLNRIVIKDGTIGARLRFRAAAADRAAVQYATGSDPSGGSQSIGRLGSAPTASTMVSTVGVNVQSDSELKAELFGEVKINFASETLPLDRFLDDTKRAQLERHSRRVPNVPAAPAVTAPALPAPGTGNT